MFNVEHVNQQNAIEQLAKDIRYYDIEEIVQYHEEDGKLVSVECKYLGVPGTSWENAYPIFLEYPVRLRKFCKDQNLELPTPPE